MQHFTDAIQNLRDQIGHLERQVAMARPGGGNYEPPLFVTIGVPPVTEEQLERLLAQDAG